MSTLFERMFGAKKEVYGDYRIAKVGSKEYLMQDYGNCKVGYKSGKCFELPVSYLTPEQRNAWQESIKAGKPTNPLTQAPIATDGPTGAMLMMLMRRKSMI